MQKSVAGDFIMTHKSEAFRKEYPDKKEYLQNELKSLGMVEPDQLHHALTDKVEEKQELQALAESIKSVYYQAYKTAYSSSNDSSSLGEIQPAEKRE